MIVNEKHYRTVWMEGDCIKLIDQPKLPHYFEIAECKNYLETAEAIKTMIVRGAGAIGATGAYGLAQATLQLSDNDLFGLIKAAKHVLANTRPTAQNLFYGLEKVERAIFSTDSPQEARKRAVEAAEAVAQEDVDSCKRIGELGAELIKPNMRLNTHCNAGWLAFVDWGSALSPIYQAQRQGKEPFVYVDETRPRGQGARLTAWELGQEGVKHSVIADNAAGFYMARGKIDMVIVGSDRIALNGDVANKIGTYTSALAAKASGIPFYVAAPTSTIDWDCESGDLIPIEERSPDEVHHTQIYNPLFTNRPSGFQQLRTTPRDSQANNPAFDVTPAQLITGIITEKGIFKPEELVNLLLED